MKNLFDPTLVDDISSASCASILKVSTISELPSSPDSPTRTQHAFTTQDSERLLVIIVVMSVISPRNIMRCTEDDGGNSRLLHARLMLSTHRPARISGVIRRFGGAGGILAEIGWSCRSVHDLSALRWIQHELCDRASQLVRDSNL